MDLNFVRFHYAVDAWINKDAAKTECLTKENNATFDVQGCQDWHRIVEVNRTHRRLAFVVANAVLAAVPSKRWFGQNILCNLGEWNEDFD